MARGHVDLENREVVPQHQGHAVVLSDTPVRAGPRRRARHWARISGQLRKRSPEVAPAFIVSFVYRFSRPPCA